ncbi:hypothetical protein GWD46_22995, partial [Salmonella enterica subsp. enterica serovar Typhi]|nr:hypothetical protein [Salmonella enterica subsp. enterica serovar Typhi]
VLLGILVLPLSVPVLIFATAAMDAASMHLPVDVGADGRPAARRRPAGHSGAAAECPGADFRHRGDGRGIDAFTR